MTMVLRELQDERFQIPFVVRLSNHGVIRRGFSTLLNDAHGSRRTGVL
jgi:hypothetical protein